MLGRGGGGQRTKEGRGGDGSGVECSVEGTKKKEEKIKRAKRKERKRWK